MANRLRATPGEYQFRPRRTVLNERPPEKGRASDVVSVPRWLMWALLLILVVESIALVWIGIAKFAGRPRTSTTQDQTKTPSATISNWFAVPDWGVGMTLPSDWSMLKRDGNVISFTVGAGSDSPDRGTLTRDPDIGQQTFDALLTAKGFTSDPIATAPNHTPAIKAFDKEGWVHIVWKSDAWYDLAYPKTLSIDPQTLIDPITTEEAASSRDVVGVESTGSGQTYIYRYTADGKKRTVLFTDADEALGVKAIPQQFNSSSELLVLMGNRENESANQFNRITVDGQGRKTALGPNTIGSVIQYAIAPNDDKVAWTAADGTIGILDVASKTTSTVPNLTGAKSLGWYDAHQLLVRTTDGWKVVSPSGEAATDEAQGVAQRLPQTAASWTWDPVLKSWASADGAIHIVAGSYTADLAQPGSVHQVEWSIDGRSIGLIKDGPAGSNSEIGVLTLNGVSYAPLFTGNNRTKTVIGWLQTK